VSPGYVDLCCKGIVPTDSRSIFYYYRRILAEGAIKDRLQSSLAILSGWPMLLTALQQRPANTAPNQFLRLTVRKGAAPVWGDIPTPLPLWLGPAGDKRPGVNPTRRRQEDVTRRRCRRPPRLRCEIGRAGLSRQFSWALLGDYRRVSPPPSERRNATLPNNNPQGQRSSASRRCPGPTRGNAGRERGGEVKFAPRGRNAFFACTIQPGTTPPMGELPSGF
jgi:hypothetical protein